MTAIPIYPSPEIPENSQKVSKKVSKDLKKSQKVLKTVLWDLFDTFLTLWAGRPGKTSFESFLGISGLRELETTVYVREEQTRFF